MSEETFEIVFRGDITMGQPIDRVKARMGQLFKLAPAQVDKLFLGKAVVLKRGLSKTQAAQYQQAFAKTGAIVSVVATVAADPASAPAGLSLAPVGAVLLTARERHQTSAVAPVTNHLSLRPLGGDLLDAAEQAEDEAEPILVADWGLAELGALLDTLTEESVPLPIVEANWELNELGTDLSDSADSVPMPVSAPEFDIAPVGSDLVEPSETIPVMAPSTDHLQLADS